ncbi:MAG: PEP-CTERM sorting domain-containing protein [Rhodoferax sp.]|nr:PEP-CTERM sorting domain-containing protein [Rhodoferax sp.]MCB2003517.1 PEP-CTERM sorting domain-containing protein [Rhodoferax sp.]MCB2030049.1 PEP-CTERM sorting domain-containing protein [Rhodoferax sp.]
MFRNDGGVLAVDMNLLDDGGNLLYSVTRTNAADDIATTVGGNRYGWFTYNNIANLAIDNTALAATGAQVPEPGSLALIALGMVALGASARRRRSQAAA